MNSVVARNALVLLAVVAAGAVLYLLADILTPLALAFFLLIMVDGLARVLRTRIPGLPRWAPMPLSITVSVLVLALALYIVVEQASDFIGQLITYGPRLNGLIARFSHLAGYEVAPTVSELVQRLNPTRYIGRVASGVQGFTSDAIFVLIYAGFLLASRKGFTTKFEALFRDREERRQAADAVLRIRNGVEGYLWISTVTGAMVAGLSWALMAAIGLDNAFFWAFLIFIVQYIPIVGGIVGVAFPPLFALVQFEALGPALILLGGLYAITFVIGNVVLPRMQGDSLNLDPVVVLLALAFWGAIWGITGAFLSTPLTVMAMVILAQSKGGRWIAVLLSADGHPEQTGGEDGRAGRRKRAQRKSKEHRPLHELASGDGPGRGPDAAARDVSGRSEADITNP